jgi:hypothetical protein
MNVKRRRHGSGRRHPRQGRTGRLAVPADPGQNPGLQGLVKHGRQGCVSQHHNIRFPKRVQAEGIPTVFGLKAFTFLLYFSSAGFVKRNEPSKIRDCF